jgi:hypothetical protein
LFDSLLAFYVCQSIKVNSFIGAALVKETFSLLSPLSEVAFQAFQGKRVEQAGK